MTDADRVPHRADARRNRNAVLAAAVRVLSERPEASMREVAEASGVGRTTVYRHFPTREDLVRALFRRVFDEAQEIAERHVAAGRRAWGASDDAATAGDHDRVTGRPAPDDADALEVVVRMTVAFAELGERYRFLGVHRELEQEQVDALQAEQGTEPLGSYLADARARGQLRDDLTVAWMLDVLHGLTMTAAQHVRQHRTNARELRPMLEATVRGALGPPPA